MVRQLLSLQLFVFSVLLFASNTLLAEVTAKINRTVLSIDETLMMKIVQTNGSSGDPDLSELRKSFQILSQSQSQNFSFINGKSSSSHTWDLTLLPKNTGEVMIPAIPVGSESTQPLRLLVKKPSATPAIDGKELFIEVSITPDKQVYVQQQVLLTVSLFSRIRFTNASLTEPEIENAVVERIGEENNYQKVIGQYSYDVIERRYAVYPQQSGSLEIPGILFSGNVQLQQRGFSLFSRSGRRIISRTESSSLKVLPIPDAYTGKIWLPAKHISIESNILEDEQSIKAGEALTRHIVTSAVGLIGSQLPASTVASSADYKSYPDKEILSSQLIDNEIVGTRQDSMAIIPLHAGKITLPEIKVDWWNTDTQQQESTILPAKTLMVAKNEALPDLVQKPATAVQNIVQPAPQRQASTEIRADQSGSSQTGGIVHNLWFWISLLLLLVWFVTLGMLLSSRRKVVTTEAVAVKSTSAADIQHLQKQLKLSCAHNDPLKTSQLIVQWAKLYFADNTLSGLSRVMEMIEDPALIHEINRLEQSRYAAVQQHWEGKPLYQALEQYLLQRQQTEQHDKQQALAPLNLT